MNAGLADVDGANDAVGAVDSAEKVVKTVLENCLVDGGVAVQIADEGRFHVVVPVVNGVDLKQNQNFERRRRKIGIILM